MTEIQKKRIEAFLKELSELTTKYGLAICGCGCCGSPYIEDLNDPSKNVIFECLTYDEEKKRYY